MSSAAILLVEDNDDNRRISSTILTFSGYGVIEEVDGWEVTRRLEANALTAGIPSVALTAHALAADRAMAAEVGCDGYIAKPAEPRTVLEEARRRIGAPTIA